MVSVAPALASGASANVPAPAQAPLTFALGGVPGTALLPGLWTPHKIGLLKAWGANFQGQRRPQATGSQKGGASQPSRCGRVDFVSLGL